MLIGSGFKGIAPDGSGPHDCCHLMAGRLAYLLPAEARPTAKNVTNDFL